MYSELSKIADYLDKSSEDISGLWCVEPLVEETFKRTKLDRTKFETMFAPKIIDYFVSVVRAENEAGNCPVVHVMLNVFDRLNMKIEDIFMICTHLKNVLLDFAITDKNFEMATEIQYILDKNLYGVIQGYMDIRYPRRHLNLKREKKTQEITNELPEDNTVISAKEYCELAPLDSDLYEDFRDFDDDAYNIIHSLKRLDEEQKENILNVLNLFNSVLNRTLEFKDIHGSINVLIVLIYELDLEIDKLDLIEYKNFINKILEELVQWKNKVYFDKILDDIHYYDASIKANVDQLYTLLNPPKDTEMKFF